MENNRQKLYGVILNKAIKWGEAFGQHGRSRWFFDLREILMTKDGLELCISLIYDKIKHLDFDTIGGPSLAAEPLVAGLIVHCQNKGKRVNGFIVRKHPNNFGLRKTLEGNVKRGDRVIIVDDLINSGSSTSRTINELNQLECRVVKTVHLVDFSKNQRKRVLDDFYITDSIFSVDDFNLDQNHKYAYSESKIIEIDNKSKSDLIKAKISSIISKPVIYKIDAKKSTLVSSDDGCVYCFDTDFNLNWKKHYGKSILSLAEGNNGLILVCVGSGLSRSIFYVINSEDGSMVNKVLLSGKIHSDPLRTNKGYLIFCDKKLLYIEDNKIIWKYLMYGKLLEKPVVDVNKNRLCFGTSNGIIHCIVSSGNLLWKKHLGNLSCPPAILGERILINSEIGMIFCINSKNGEILWLHELKNKSKCLVIHENHAVVCCSEGFLIYLNINNGSVEESTKVSQDIEQMKIVNDKILIELKNGSSYSIE